MARIHTTCTTEVLALWRLVRMMRMSVVSFLVHQIVGPGYSLGWKVARGVGNPGDGIWANDHTRWSTWNGVIDHHNIPVSLMEPSYSRWLITEESATFSYQMLGSLRFELAGAEVAPISAGPFSFSKGRRYNPSGLDLAKIFPHSAAPNGSIPRSAVGVQESTPESRVNSAVTVVQIQKYV